MQIQSKMKVLKASVAIGALLGVVGVAAAQEDVETVVVTGSRIVRPEIEMPNPVQSISGADIANVGTTNLTTYLQQMPALVGSLTQYQTSGYNTPSSGDGFSLAGLNLLNLRSLGYVRTLTLVDGRRQVSSAMGSAAVDTNTIPMALIERVDISTGGASSIYGADGVSGVVNFVMKHDLKGLHASVEGGLTQFGGANTMSGSIAYGMNTDDGRGNVAVAFEYGSQGRLNYTQRSFTKVGGFTGFLPNPYGTKYAYIPTNQYTFIWSGVHGAITSDWLSGMAYPDYTGAGEAYTVGDTYNGISSIGGSGQPAANVLQGNLMPKTRRYIADVTGKYDFNRYAVVTANFRYAHVYSDSFSTPVFDDYVAIEADNAFLPSNVAAAIASGSTGYGILSEDYLSLRREEATYRDTYQANVTVTGDITPATSFVQELTYNLAASWGKTDVDDVDVRNRVEDRFFAALDSVTDPSTGKATCRSNLNATAVPRTLSEALGIDGFSDTSMLSPSNFGATFTPGANSGCVAFNPFDPNPKNQKAAISWITMPTHTRGHITQEVITGSLSAKFPQTQVVFAAPLNVVIGGEYRFEKSVATGDPNARGGKTFDPAPDNAAGSYSVSEAFAEISQSLVKDVKFVKELSVDVAARYSSYSSSGTSTTWSLGGVYAPFESLRFRATDAYAVRAPNIGEMFAPSQSGYSNVNDPCDASNVTAGTQYRLANCKAIMQELGVAYTPGSTNLATGSTTLTYTSGNKDLKPETARTFTAGVVVTPEWIPNLAITADWYRVTINNAITAPDAQEVAEQCVDASTINNTFCSMITRTASGNVPGALSVVRVTQVNVATYETSGVDYTITYHLDTMRSFNTDAGAFDFHINGNILNALATTPLPGEDPEVKVGQAATLAQEGAPKYQAKFGLNWTYGAFDLSYDIDWFSSTYRWTRKSRYGNPNYSDPKYWKMPERFLNNVQFAYSTENGYRFYAGVNNLFNQKPAFASSGYPVDPTGRYFYFGIKLSTDGGMPGVPQF